MERHNPFLTPKWVEGVTDVVSAVDRLLSHPDKVFEELLRTADMNLENHQDIKHFIVLINNLRNERFKLNKIEYDILGGKDSGTV